MRAPNVLGIPEKTVYSVFSGVGARTYKWKGDMRADASAFSPGQYRMKGHPYMPIKREGFVERLNEKGYTKKDARIIIDDVFGTIAEILAQGGSVKLHGFGTFETARYAAREMTSVHGRKTVAPEHRVVKFKPGKLLKRLVSGEQTAVRPNA